jgi:hypothetical protein
VTIRPPLGGTVPHFNPASRKIICHRRDNYTSRILLDPILFEKNAKTILNFMCNVHLGLIYNIERSYSTHFFSKGHPRLYQFQRNFSASRDRRLELRDPVWKPIPLQMAQKWSRICNLKIWSPYFYTILFHGLLLQKRYPSILSISVLNPGGFFNPGIIGIEIINPGIDPFSFNPGI